MTGERCANGRPGEPRDPSRLASLRGNAIAAARGLLCLRSMKLLMKMLGIGALVAAGIYYDRHRLRIAGRLDAAGPLGSDRGSPGMRTEVVTDAVIVGIAEVDPVPLANVAGERIDPDARR